MRATGTTDDAVAVGCTVGCNPCGEIDRFQPFSTGPMATDSTAGQKRKNPQFPAENAANEGVRELETTGIEPATFGLQSRRSPS